MHWFVWLVVGAMASLMAVLGIAALLTREK